MKWYQWSIGMKGTRYELNMYILFIHKLMYYTLFNTQATLFSWEIQMFYACRRTGDVGKEVN